MAAIIKRELLLEGLDCANCSSKIEYELSNIDGINANINFMTKILTLEIDDGYVDNVIEQISEIVNKYEPHVKIIDKNHKTHENNGHGRSHGVSDNKKELIRLGIGAILFFIAILFKLPDMVELSLYFISYFLVGGEVLLRAAKNIKRGQVFDENFLMSIATIGAFLIGEFPEGVAVMLFYQIGELFQDHAVNHSRKSIASLMDIKPDYANKIVDGKILQVTPEEVNIGDYILIRPGEKVPLDGIIIDGNSMMDTSALTGESIPREVGKGSNVLSGFINTNGLLKVEVAKEFGQSTVSRILELVENASSKKAPTENFITKFARYYTPVVVYIALGLAIIPPLLIKDATLSDWFYRALVFLVVSCPCALVISIPLGFFGGIGGASKNGILIKGGNYLEALNDAHTIVFDKTGTLTKGVFKVTNIALNSDVLREELLEYAAFAESHSTHPIATSILKEHGKEINKEEIEYYEEIPGHGTFVKIKGQDILAGNKKLMDLKNVKYNEVETIGTVVYIALNGVLAGSITISDEVKTDSKAAIKALRNIGIKKIIMLTGDNKHVGTTVAKELGVDEVYTELLPDQKVDRLELLKSQSKGKLVFVGDGINDAPVLARADIGVAMGALGSDAAIEAADIVLMTDEPMKLVSAIKIAKRTKQIVWQNIIFAFSVKAIVLVLGAGGLASMWEAVFADVGVALIAVLNAIRVLNTKDL